MVDFTTEQIISIAEAARRLPPRRRRRPLSVSTVHRWATQGVAGVVLETLVVGGHRVTSVEALQRFAERCTAKRQRFGARGGRAHA